MKKLAYTLLLCLTAVFSQSILANDAPRILLKTNHGNIVLELNTKDAPLSTSNFIKYVEDGYYDGTIFHRVISNFMIQGGGFTKDFEKKPTRAPIKNESNNNLKNVRGTIAMARTNDPHSASAQFFINVVNNASLNYGARGGWGYAVFGKVVEGMDTVDKIRYLSTGNGGPFPSNVPQTIAIIEKASVINKETKTK